MYSLTCDGETIASNLTAPQASAAFCNFTAGDAEGNYEIAQSPDEEINMNRKTETVYGTNDDTFQIHQTDDDADDKTAFMSFVVMNQYEALDAIAELTRLINKHTNKRVILNIW